MTRSAAAPLFLLLAAALAPCAMPGAAQAQTPAAALKLQAPAQLHDGWQTAAPEQSGLSPQPIRALLAAIRADTFPDVHSLLLVHHGKLVLEQYFPGYAWSYSAEGFRGPRTDFGPDVPDNMASVTKSVTGLVVGIAHDRGALPDIDARVFSFFPEYARFAVGGKDAITLRHLLLMASGLAWNEQDVFYSDPRNDIVQLFTVADPLAHILSKELAHPPATVWYYNGGGISLVGEAVHRASGMPLAQLAQQHLFQPLQITGASWGSIRPGLADASGGLHLRPRDMAKLGQLVLQGGTWQGKRIVSREWIDSMTARSVRFDAVRGYGFGWWMRTFLDGADSVHAVYADGWGGQRIMVFPELDLVAVFTGGSYLPTQPPRLDEIVARYVIPAVRSRS